MTVISGTPLAFSELCASSAFNELQAQCVDTCLGIIGMEDNKTLIVSIRDKISVCQWPCKVAVAKCYGS